MNKLSVNDLGRLKLAISDFENLTRSHAKSQVLPSNFSIETHRQVKGSNGVSYSPIIWRCVGLLYPPGTFIRIHWSHTKLLERLNQKCVMPHIQIKYLFCYLITWRHVLVKAPPPNVVTSSFVAHQLHGCHLPHLASRWKGHEEGLPISWKPWPRVVFVFPNVRSKDKSGGLENYSLARQPLPGSNSTWRLSKALAWWPRMKTKGKPTCLCHWVDTLQVKVLLAAVLDMATLYLSGKGWERGNSYREISNPVLPFQGRRNRSTLFMEMCAWKKGR